ncbi:hypothetical protein FN846DRAFT_896678 [Sphaerosporella brunnea]|uniref:Uncharacterized protein n=1 Tax=Sphaerosporella brunnea TaxID=1250544 RepID=A0A5J5EC71_9PEZI|nr:hypothetical protein FN846DRAFT_896678 [Sphaerosporella brunnea]
MSISDLVTVPAPVTGKAKSPSANHKPAFIHRAHHCPVCKHAIPAKGDQVKRCLKAGHVEECPHHPGHFNAVGGYGRGCAACRSESRAAERKKAAEKKAENEKRRIEEEKEMWSRKRRRSITPESGSDTSNSSLPKKKKKGVNKKVRR